ncbi:MAG: ankyrin repeat domain-containing protein [Coxiellaceae bacterium]|nr:ankyrin repeat domain-containing protein [Coxiellaceae bacterium]
MRLLRRSQPFNFFVRPYLTHLDLLDRSNRAGYPPQQGYCHGLSCYAAYSIITNQWHFFDSHLKKISAMSDPLNEMDQHTIRFFDALTFAQNPEQYSAFYKTNQTRDYAKQDPHTALHYFALQDNIEISRSAYFSTLYTKEELSQCFALMQKMNRIFPHNFSLILSSFSHSIAAHIDQKFSRWHLIDANQMPKQIYESNEHFAAAVNQALSDKRDESVIHIHAFITDENKATAKAFWRSLRKNPEWKKLHDAEKKAALFNNSMDNWLHMAAAEGLRNEVFSLLKHKAPVNQLAGTSTALTLACKNGRFSIAKLLLQNGAYPNLGSPTPLAHASYNGDIKIARLLLAKGAKPDAGIFALFNAQEVNNQEEFNKTPLEIAIGRHDIAMVGLLLEHGADPNRGSPAPFFQAANNPEIASLLTAYGAKVGSQLFCRHSFNKNTLFALSGHKKPYLDAHTLSTFCRK